MELSLYLLLIWPAALSKIIAEGIMVPLGYSTASIDHVVIPLWLIVSAIMIPVGFKIFKKVEKLYHPLYQIPFMLFYSLPVTLNSVLVLMAMSG